MRLCTTYWYRKVSAVLLMSAGQFIVSSVYKERGYPRNAYTCREHFGKETKKPVLLSLPLGLGLEDRGGWKLTLAPKPFYTTWIFFFFNQVHALLFWLKEKRTTSLNVSTQAGRRSQPSSETVPPWASTDAPSTSKRQRPVGEENRMIHIG